jgi:hypothetical protein
MKVLLTNTIRPKGIGMGDQMLTLFNDPSPEQMASRKYFDLSKLSGGGVHVSFSYEEGDATLRSTLAISVPASLGAGEVRDMIIHEIQEKLKD